MLKTHTCKDISELPSGQIVTLAGWLQSCQNEVPLVFELRDQWGTASIVVEDLTLIDKIRSLEFESVLQVVGVIRTKSREETADTLKKQEMEVLATQINVLNRAAPLPFRTILDEDTNEYQEQAYRFVALRQPRLRKNLEAVANSRRFIRTYLETQGFTEVLLAQEYERSFHGDLNSEYLTPSRLSLAPLFESSFLEMKRCYQFVHAPITPGIPLPLGIEGTSLSCGITHCQSPANILVLTEGLVKALADFYECPIDDIPTITYSDFINDAQPNQLRQAYSVSILGPLYAVNNETPLCLVNVQPPVRFGPLSNEPDWLLEMLNAYQVTQAGWVVREKSGHVVIKQYGKFPPISTDNDQVRQLDNSKYVGTLLLAMMPDIVGSFEQEFRDKVTKDSTLANSLPEMYWLAEEPLLVDAYAGWRARYHMFVAPLRSDLQHLSVDPKSVRGETYNLMCGGLSLGYAYARNNDRKVQDALFRLFQLSDAEISSLDPVISDAFHYGVPLCGLELQVEKLVAVLLGETDITKMFPFP